MFALGARSRGQPSLSTWAHNPRHWFLELYPDMRLEASPATGIVSLSATLGLMLPFHFLELEEKKLKRSNSLACLLT